MHRRHESQTGEGNSRFPVDNLRGPSQKHATWQAVICACFANLSRNEPDQTLPL
jgi:hypothetical protein